MNTAGEIISITPKFAIPTAQIVIDCRGFPVAADGDQAVMFNDLEGRILAASHERIIVEVPAELDATDVAVALRSGEDKSEPFAIKVGKRIVEDMHIVANPAIDPKDDSLIVTRSGSRGQQLSVTLFRVDTDGFVSDINAEVLNPTAIAFNKQGEMFVTSRADGVVYRIDRDEEAVKVASGLGIATGLAFDAEGTMFVGDRAGTIFRITEFGLPEEFSALESSVAAYHFAFGVEGEVLYITAPTLSSFDSVFWVDPAAFDQKYFRGLGRPQGLAFDADGNLYVAACYSGRRGIVKIPPGGESAELFVAGNNVVGLCFDRKGNMLVATNDSVFSLPLGIRGILLD